jgi:hypothetical protein
VLNEFVEIGRQLQSLHIVITNLKEQEFRDNARAARHAQAVSEDRKNKMVAILTRPGNFSSNKGKLTVQISTLDAFMRSLSLGALIRMEPMLLRIHQLLEERARGSVVAAQPVLSARPDRQEDWQRLEMDLRIDGIPLEYLRDNREQIRAVLSSVVESNYLEGYDSGIENEPMAGAGASDSHTILPDDSVSQVQGRPKSDPRNSQRGARPLNKPVAKKSPKQPMSSRRSFSMRSERRKLSTSGWLKTLSPEENDSRILLMYDGFDVRNFKHSKAFGLDAIFGKPDTIQADAVCWAAMKGNDVALKLLLDKGCDPSSQAKHPSGSKAKAGPLYWAIESEKLNCV